MKKFPICGLPATGKIILIKMFDGHPKVAAKHTHDKILSIFLPNNIRRLFEIFERLNNDHYFNSSNKNRKFLVNSSGEKVAFTPLMLKLALHQMINMGYQLPAIYHDVGGLRSDISSAISELEPFSFKFQHYENLWMKKIDESPVNISVEALIDIFLRSYFETDNTLTPDTENYFFLAPNDPEEVIKFCLESSDNFRPIYLRRNMANQTLSRAFRILQREKNAGRVKSLTRIIFGLVTTKQFAKAIAMHQRIVANAINIDLVIFDIDRFFTDQQAYVREFADKLNIEYDIRLTMPSIRGTPVSSQYFTAENDDTSKISDYLSYFLHRACGETVPASLRSFRYEFSYWITFGLVVSYVHVRKLLKK